MNSITGIAGSALSSYGIRQAVTANNVANVLSSDFTASSVVTRESPHGGVSAAVRQGSDRVELSKEALDLASNSSGFKASLKTMKAADEMTKELLRLKA